MPSALKDVKKAFEITVLLVALISLGLPGLVAKLTEDYERIWDVFALTVPISVWAGITTYVYLATRWPAISQFIVSVLVLTVATLLADRYGVGASIGEIWDQAHGQIGRFFGLMVTKYALRYGAGAFVCALIVGGFLGYATWRVLRPRRR
jgi:hypothetical protein